MTDAATTPEPATPRPGPMMLVALFVVTGLAGLVASVTFWTLTERVHQTTLALTRREAPRDGDSATAGRRFLTVLHPIGVMRRRRECGVIAEMLDPRRP